MGRNAGPGPLGKRIGKGLPDFSRPEDVALEIHALPGRADRGEHGGKRLVTVEQRSDSIAAHCRRSQQVAQRTLELRATDWVLVRDGSFEVFVAAGEIGVEQNSDQRHRYGGGRPGSPGRSELETHGLAPWEGRESRVESRKSRVESRESRVTSHESRVKVASRGQSLRGGEAAAAIRSRPRRDCFGRS